MRYQKYLSLTLIPLTVLLLSACSSLPTGIAEMPEELRVIKLDTSGFTEVQRESLVNRLERAGTEVTDDAEAKAPVLSVRLEEPRESSLFSPGELQRYKYLTQQMFYQVTAADGELLLQENRLRQESAQGVDQFNPRSEAHQSLKQQQHMQNVMTSRMIYQLQQM